MSSCSAAQLGEPLGDEPTIDLTIEVGGVGALLP